MLEYLPDEFYDEFLYYDDGDWEADGMNDSDYDDDLQQELFDESECYVRSKDGWYYGDERPKTIGEALGRWDKSPHS